MFPLQSKWAIPAASRDLLSACSSRGVQLCVLVAMATALSHIMSLAATGRIVRCVVLDPDNLLWSGKLGQNESEDLELEPNLAIQKVMVALIYRDVSLVVVSRNDIRDLLRPFETHPGMPLRKENVSLFQPDWDSRPESLRTIRDKLGVPFDQTVYLDANPFQRGLVHAALPEVTVCGPTSETFPEPDFAGVDDFLECLGMRMALNRFDEVHLSLISGLTQRSAQFNLTGHRYTPADCKALMHDPTVLPLYVVLNDRVGDHGIIATVVLAQQGDEMAIRDWVMNTAMMDRGVEHELMNRVVALAQSRGCTRLSGEYIRTPRNAVVSEFFAQFGFTMIGEEADHTLWVLPLAAYEPVSTFLAVTTNADVA